MNYQTDKLKQIAERIRAMREISGFSIEEMAEKTEVTVQQYEQYENGMIDFPFTFIHKCLFCRKKYLFTHKQGGILWQQSASLKHLSSQPNAEK